MLSSLTTQTSVQAHTFHPYDSESLISGFRDKPTSLRLPSLSKLVGLLTGNHERKLDKPLVEPPA